MAGLAGHELLAGGCLSRCAARLPKRSREDEAAAAAGNGSEAHVPRAKRLQRAAQMVDQLHALNIVNAAGHHAPLPLSPVAAAAPPPAAPCNALAVWSPLPFGGAPLAPPRDDTMDDGAAAQEPPRSQQPGLRLSDVMLRPGVQDFVPQRPHPSAGALVVWAGQPNISSVVQRAAARCGLLRPPRAPSTPSLAADDDDDGAQPQAQARPRDDALMSGGEEASQETSQDAMMALD